jgi:hypothetical protein
MSFGAADFFYMPEGQLSTRKRDFRPKASASMTRRCSTGYDHAEVTGKKHYLFLDAQRCCVFASVDLMQLLGYTRTELMRLRLDDLVPDELEFNEVGWLEFVESGHRDHFMVLRTRSGDVIGFHTQSRRLPDGCLVAIFAPLT